MEINWQKFMFQVLLPPRSSSLIVTNILLLSFKTHLESPLWESIIWKIAWAGASKKEVHNLFKKSKLQEIMKSETWNGEHLTKSSTIALIKVDWLNTISKLKNKSFKKTFTRMKFSQSPLQKISACFSLAVEMDHANFYIHKLLKRWDLMISSSHAEMPSSVLFMKQMKTKSSMCFYAEDKTQRMSQPQNQARVDLKWRCTI